MVTSSRFGTQPLNQILKERKLSKPKVAEDIGVGLMHLRNSAYGYCSPKLELRERLTKYLDLDLEDMFTREALDSRPYYGDVGWKSIKPMPRSRDDDAEG